MQNMPIMPIIIFTIVATAISLIFNQWIRKHALIFYAIAIAASIAAMLLVPAQAVFSINQGFLGLGFFIVMMFAGALDKTKSYTKKLMAVRAEISIVAYILLFAHGWQFLFDKWDLKIILAIISYVIMMPLFITSFKTIRKKMKFADWKKLHKLSYIVYAVTFLHLFLAATQLPNKILYVVIFGTYFVMRVLKAWKAKKKKEEKAKLRAAKTN